MSPREFGRARSDRRRRITVLMYHAVVDEHAAQHADPHYAVSATAFAQHLELFVRAGRRPTSVQRLLDDDGDSALALTFDDGHASDVRAAEMIAERGGRADFFVNPSTVGHVGHLGWSDLRSLSELGMSIQSHGLTHRHLDTLAPAEVRSELADSKRCIEDKLGRAVELFAPPGGRMPADLPRMARALGYRAVCSSRVGVWHATPDSPEIPRMPVLRSTTPARLRRWIEQDASALAAARLRHATLSAAKQLLPSAVYEGIRSALIGTSARGRHG